MVEELEAGGLRFVGRDETGMRMEIVELGPEHGHPFFVGAQFHPEVRAQGPLLGLRAQGLGAQLPPILPKASVLPASARIRVNLSRAQGFRAWPPLLLHGQAVLCN